MQNESVPVNYQPTSSDWGTTGSNLSRTKSGNQLIPVKNWGTRLSASALAGLAGGVVILGLRASLRSGAWLRDALELSIQGGQFLGVDGRQRCVFHARTCPGRGGHTSAYRGPECRDRDQRGAPGDAGTALLAHASAGRPSVPSGRTSPRRRARLMVVTDRYC